MIPKSLKNNQGLTMIEMLVSTAIGLLMMGVAIYTFTNQQSIMRDQKADAQIRGQGRLAINKIAKDIRNAGAGIPVPLKFEVASSTVFRYKTNPNDGPTPIASDVTATSAAFELSSVSDFAATQPVVVYILGEMYSLTPTKPNILSVIGSIDTATKIVTLTSAATVDYSSYATVMNPYERITYTHDTANNRIIRNVNGTNFPFIEDVTGLTFAYKNKAGTDLGNPVTTANLPTIRKIEITLSFQDPIVPNANVDLRTDVFIRNTDDDI